MTRHHPLLVPALVAPGLAAAILAASAAIIFTRPAHGQECRFQFQCPFVALPASKAAPAIRYRVREVRRVVRHYPVRVAAAKPAVVDDSMPLVWPVMEPEEVQGPDRLETFAGDDVARDRAKITLSGVKLSAGTGASGVESSNLSRSTIPHIAVLHTRDGQYAILSAFLLLVAVTTARFFPRLNGATA